MKKVISAILMIVTFTTLIFSQNLRQTVRGTITDSDNRLPLPGATVIIPGTDPLTGTTTDAGGIFRFDNIPFGSISLTNSTS